MIKKSLIILQGIVLILLLSCSEDDTDVGDNTDPIDVPQGYTLVWSDEFNDLTINPANWNYEIGDGTDYGLPAGWGNNEKQIYTNSSENSSIEIDEGASGLVITTLEDGSGGYTSAKLTTKDLHSVRFGRVDVRAKMPQGKGLWPAIWMLGDNRDEISWPGCGEIDIAEVLGHETTMLYSTLHYTDGDHKHGELQATHELSADTYSDSYHTYILEWTPETLAFALDGESIGQFAIAEDMKEFLRSFNLILNVAVGGNWPGDPDASTVFPQKMHIDFVRVYSKDGMEIPDEPVLDVEEETVGQIIEANIGNHAIRDGFDVLGNLSVIPYGPGEPGISASDVAIDGDSSLVYSFPGSGWGGAYILLDEPTNLSAYSNLVFSLKEPANLTNAEIKLESEGNDAVVFLANYTGMDVEDGFVEYTIPLADFTGLELNAITIPFAMWNPQDANSSYVVGIVLIDNVYFSN